MGAVLSAVALVALSAGWVGGGSANAAPLPVGFPIAPVLNVATGLPICDALDESPNYADIACNTVDTASAYFGGNGTVLGAGFVLEDTPVVGTNQAPFSSTTYVVELGVAGVHKASIGIDAKGTNDTDYVYAGCAGAAAPTYTLLLSTALLDGTVTVVPDGLFTRVTFNVPIAALATCGITPATALAPFFGTSQAGPLDNINKDFFIGKKVDFGVIGKDVTAQAPDLVQSVCVRGAASTPTYTTNDVTGVIYSVGLAQVTGTNNGVAGTTIVMTAAADTAKGFKLDAASPTSFDMVFTAAPTNCSPTAVGATLTQSVCVGNVATVPSYAVNAVTGVIYSVGGVVKTGAGNPGVAGTTIVLHAAADTANGFALKAGTPTDFDMVFTAAPNCAPFVPPVIIPVPSPSPSPSPSASPSPSPTPAPVDQDLGISKTGLEDSVVPGDVLSWSVNVTNVKGTPASAFTVTDVLADGLTFLTAGGVDWSCTNAGQKVTCTYSGAPLAVGSSSAFQLDSLVGFDYAGSTVSNTAVVDPGGVDTTNDSATAVTPVVFTGGEGLPVVEPPAPAPAEEPAPALPFTGSYTDTMLTAGVAMLVLGLFLALGGRRRRTS